MAALVLNATLSAALPLICTVAGVPVKTGGAGRTGDPTVAVGAGVAEVYGPVVVVPNCAAR